MVKKAKGQRGSWFAAVDGQLFPCVHSHWFKQDGSYEDRFARPGDKKFEELTASIRDTGRVILTTDDVVPTSTAPEFKRTGYVALWSVRDVLLDDTGLRFRFAERLEELE